MSSQILATRAVSAFPLSIGTSLAFESLSQLGGTPYDPERKIPEHVDLKQYQQFWINLSTLFRNMHSAVPSQESTTLRAEDCADALLAEMDSIDDIVRQETNGQTEIIYYINNYKNLKSLSSIASIRIPNTPKQIEYYKLHDKTLQQLINIRHSLNRDPMIFDKMIKPKDYTVSLIFTHIAYDLLAYPKFTRLELIESHTGILKKRNMWYTKFYQPEELSMIPFIEKMLKIFGDNHTFRPFPIKARKTIAELAIGKRWTWATTESKVTADLDTLKDRFLADNIKLL